MKKILITGAGSYIGTSFERYIQQWPDAYTVDTLDMVDPAWRNYSFSGYDCVYHIAGIAHQKETPENAASYYKVNCDLAVETAKKAKKCGVRHFIFLSSMSVYGMDTGIITKDTVPTPKSHYGKSKLQAEQALEKLQSEDFKIAIARPPMVYGRNCKGNFQKIVKIVRKLPVFPKVKNQRSSIYIDHLSAFIKLLIDREAAGLYFPQNKEYLQTTSVAAAAAQVLHKKIYYSRLLGVLITCGLPFVSLLKKAFGNLMYENLEVFDFCYCETDTEASYHKSI